MISKWLIVLVCFVTVSATAQNKPNIILILADDLGYKDCGFTGSKTFETPNIDALAKNGMVFNQAYAAAGNCAPSRACLISGKYTPTHGVYAVGSTTRGPKKHMKVVPVTNSEHLDGKHVTIAEALKKQGYATGIFGKWHLENEKDSTTSPLQQGFDTYYDSRLPDPNKKRNEPEDPKGIYSLTNAALQFINNNSNKPFFAFISHHAVHAAIEAKPASIEYFKNKGLGQRMAPYAASIYDLDNSIGLVMDALKKAGIDKNTIIIFTSDNGATPLSNQEPLRGSKGIYYEAGIKVPFVAYWPGKINAGSTSEVPIINLDLYPTFVTSAGSKPKNVDGQNLLPLFYQKQKTDFKRCMFWHFPGYLDGAVKGSRDTLFRTRPVTVIRKGDFKLHLFHEEWLLDGGIQNLDTNNAVELYDIKNDISETKNLALTNKPKRDELVKELLAWFKKTNAKLPHPIDATHQLGAADVSSH